METVDHRGKTCAADAKKHLDGVVGPMVRRYEVSEGPFELERYQSHFVIQRMAVTTFHPRSNGSKC